MGRNPQREQERESGWGPLSSTLPRPPAEPPPRVRRRHVPAYFSKPPEQEPGPRAAQRRRETEARLAKRSEGPARSRAEALALGQGARVGVGYDGNKCHTNRCADTKETRAENAT